MRYFEDKYPSFVAEVEKGERISFKTSGDSVIVIGRRKNSERWMLEGKYREGISCLRKTFASQAEVKFSIAYITDVIQVEGAINFNATPLRVNSPTQWYLVIILLPLLHQSANAIQQNFIEDIYDVYVSQIISHEMNHVLTNEYITEKGELNHFKSELLADCFLFQEINILPNRQTQLDVKRADVQQILSNHSWNGQNQYYKQYLTVIDKLLSHSEMGALSNKVAGLQEILAQGWNGTVSDLSDRLMAEIQTPQ
jgi:hypothetical protein